MTSRVALGIDIGGSGIKGAPVDLDRGVLLAERVKIATPVESTPHAVAAIVGEIAAQFTDTLPADAPIGVTIPGVVQHGVVRSAANIDKAWLDCPGEALFSATLGRRCLLVNDADAAGVASLFKRVTRDLGAPRLVVHNIDGRVPGIFRKGITEADPAMALDTLRA